MAIVTPRQVSADEQRAREIMAMPAQEDNQAGDRFQLANRLMDANKLEYARRVLKKTKLPEAPAERHYRILKALALCTYKNPDQPLGRRLKEAESAIKLVWSDARAGDKLQQDALGIAGAIEKRRWECYGLRKHLQAALDFYRRGYEFGIGETGDLTPSITRDKGYNAINAAFILDLLATSPDAEEIGKQQIVEANQLRSKVVEVLNALSKKREETPPEKREPLDFWFHATLGEAYLGLGNYDLAASHMAEAGGLIWDRTGEKPGHKAAPWQVEATARQSGRLAQILAGRDGIQPDAIENSKPWKVLTALLGGDAQTAASFLRGKVGLALSGGGFRASLYHIGVLARLAELDLLRHVEVLSCVSGGSILGAFYYLELRNLLQRQSDEGIKREDYITLVARVEELFLARVQRNIRLRMLFGLRSNWKVLTSRRCSTTDRLALLYETELFSAVKEARPAVEGQATHLLDDGNKDVPALLQDLRIMPLGRTTFDPKYDNWQRRNKVPNLILNATTLNTCHNWQFTASYMGEPPARDADESIGANDRLRRLYHDEAPKWYREPAHSVRLGQAVAASAGVPGLFTPLLLENLYGTTYDATHPQEYATRLIDGGTYDNQGLASLLQQDCTVLLISDASGQSGLSLEPAAGALGVLKRSNDILMARVREAQHDTLELLQRTQAIRGFLYVHLKKGLTSGPVNWLECPDRTVRDQDSECTSYGVRCDVQRLLAGIRTDLDSFSDAEADALMFSAYKMTAEAARSLPFVGEREPAAEAWRFLRIAGIAGARENDADVASLCKTLEVAAELELKPFRLVAPVRVSPLAIGIVVLIALLGATWLLPDQPWALSIRWKLLVVGGLGLGAVELVLRRVIHYRVGALRWLFALACIPGSMVLEIYLKLVEPVYVRSGPKYR